MKYITKYFNVNQTKAKDISFLHNILEYSKFPVKTYPRNIYESCQEFIAVFKEKNENNRESNNKLRTFTGLKQLVEVSKKNRYIFEERILIIEHVDFESLLNVYSSVMLKGEDSAVKHKLITIIMCSIIDSVCYDMLKVLPNIKIKSVELEIFIFTKLHYMLLHLCFLEELLPRQADSSDCSVIIIKLRKRLFGLLKLIQDVNLGDQHLTNYFISSLEMLLEKQQKNEHFVLSESNVAFLDIKYKRLYKQFQEYLKNLDKIM